MTCLRGGRKGMSKVGVTKGRWAIGIGYRTEIVRGRHAMGRGDG